MTDEGRPLVALVKKWEECSCDPEISEDARHDYEERQEELEEALKAQRQHLLNEADRIEADQFGLPVDFIKAAGLRIAADLLEVK